MRVVVVGAGLTGLVAARRLLDGGHDVVVVDKGRGPGGRMATRRIGAATLDTGAQFFTVRSDELAELVRPLLADGLVREWCRGFAGDDGHPRYVVRGGMNALAKRLAVGLDVRHEHMVFSVRPAEPAASHAWEVVRDDATWLPADAVIMTSPVPQSSSILMPAHLRVAEEVRWLGYHPTLALLVVLDGPSAVPAPGGVQEPDDTFAFIGDNHAKGLSAVPALTLHLRGEVSSTRWDEPSELLHAELLETARPWFGRADVVDSQLKRWRFATPKAPWAERCVAVDGDRGVVVMAGDAFGGPKVEGAVLSGMAAAAAVAARA